MAAVLNWLDMGYVPDRIGAGKTRHSSGKYRILALSVVFSLFIAGIASAQDIDVWKTQAAEGSVAAQFNLGLIYYKGMGVTPDPVEAARWFKIASDKGYAPAAANLGLMYFKGEGVPVDHAEAVRLFRIGAEGGDAIAQLCMATSYATGDQVPRDAVESAKWLRLSAAQGNATAQFNLGNALAAGEGVAADPAEAGYWWYMAALQGHSKARGNLANLGFWKKASAKGDLGTICWAGFALVLNGDGKGGIANLRKAGDGGYVHAQALLANAYYYGNLAGSKVPKDLKESQRWTRLAADQGDAECQYNLGMAYFQGEGVGKDAGKSLEWLLKAASQGYVDAYYNLGSLFNEAAKQQNGTMKDEILVKAYMFFALAAAKDGDEARSAQAKSAMDLVAAKMTRELVAEGQRQVELYGK